MAEKRMSLSTSQHGKTYVVFKGCNPGLYTTWEECAPQVVGFSGAMHRSYKQCHDAQSAWIKYWAMDGAGMVAVVNEDIDKCSEAAFSNGRGLSTALPIVEGGECRLHGDVVAHNHVGEEVVPVQVGESFRCVVRTCVTVAFLIVLFVVPKLL